MSTNGFGAGSLKAKIFGITFTFLITINAVIFLLPQAAYGTQPDGKASARLEYMEDKSGVLTLKQIMAKEGSADFRESRNSDLVFGSNRSIWWIRLKVGNVNAQKETLYLSFNNPSVQNIKLYIPFINSGSKGFIVKKSGWQYKKGTGDENFLYPVFKLPRSIDRSSFIYIRVQSAYAHNYEISMLTENQFNMLRQKNLIFIAVFLGLLLTMALLNFITYISFKDKAYLLYVAYITLMLLFQAAHLGVPRIFLGNPARLLIMNASAISCLMILASISFVRSFLNTRQNIPKHDLILRLLIAVSILLIIPMLSGRRLEANIGSNFLACAVAIVILSAAVLSYRKGIRQAKYFLPAWISLVAGNTVFVMRGWGILPNNFLTRHFLLISAAVEAILISFALIDRGRILQEEKQKAEILLMQATQEKKAAEISFLQAQIKPHFMYNSLSVIAALTIKNPPKAKELLYNLADYLRGSFDFKNINGMTMLPEEIATVRAYLAIEKERFRDKLTVEYDIDEDIKVSIPLLTIQPLVENALRHGIFKKPDGGCIQISVKRQNDFVKIEIRDNGVGIPESRLAEILCRDDASGVGLKNINKRLILHYGYGLEIESSEGSGTTVSIKIPDIGGRKDNA